MSAAAGSVRYQFRDAPDDGATSSSIDFQPVGDTRRMRMLQWPTAHFGPNDITLHARRYTRPDLEHPRCSDSKQDRYARFEHGRVRHEHPHSFVSCEAKSEPGGGRMDARGRARGG